MSFFWKVFAGMVAAILLTALVVDESLVAKVREGVGAEIEKRVQDTIPLVAAMVKIDSSTGMLDATELLRAAESRSGMRITIIDPEGKVLFDSHEDAARMENHSQRPEILDLGRTVARFSNTLQTYMTYHARGVMRLGKLVAYARVAMPQEGIDARLADLRMSILTSVLAAVGVALLAAFVMARRVTSPLTQVSGLISELGRGQTTKRLPETRQDEIGELAIAVNQMADELQKRVDAMARDRQQKDAILAGMSEGLIAVNHEQRIMLMNDAARRLIPVADGDPRGRSLWEVTRVTEITRAVDQCIEKGMPVALEVRLSSDDRESVLRLAAAPLREGDAPRGGCVLVLQDLSELRRLEKVRRDFVANVSHELKTPLTAMHGYVEVMHDDPGMDPEQRQKFLNKALAASERLSSILRDLFSLARIEGEDGSLAEDPVDLGDLLADCLRDALPSAETKGMTLAIECIEQPLVVLGDAEALATAFANLLDNAIKYSPSGSRVSLRCSRRGGRAHIEIEDQGCGIPMAEQQRVFERFYRVDKDRSRRLGGTGLGLSIVRNVVVAHGGEVSLRSEVGQGSVFTISLPL